MPILIVGTHTDHELCTPEYLDLVRKAIEMHFPKREYPTIMGFHPVSGTSRKQPGALEDLKKQLIDVSREKKWKLANKELPPTYIQAYEHIKAMQRAAFAAAISMQPPVLSWAEFTALIARFNLHKPEDVRGVARFLTHTGELVYIEEEDWSVKNSVFWYPPWLIDMLRSVVCAIICCWRRFWLSLSLCTWLLFSLILCEQSLCFSLAP